MMPLTLAKEGEPSSILKISGPAATRSFLEKLGFTPGASVTVLAENDGNLIVSVRDSRVAIGRDAAIKIMV